MRKSKQFRQKQIKEKGARTYREYKRMLAGSPIDPELEATRQMIDATASLNGGETQLEKLEEEMDKIINLAKEEVDKYVEEEQVSESEEETVRKEERTQGIAVPGHYFTEKHVRTCDGEHACGNEECECKYSDEKVPYEKPEVLEKVDDTPVAACPEEHKI